MVRMNVTSSRNVRSIREFMSIEALAPSILPPRLLLRLIVLPYT
jgi:hypothetical protein